MAMYRYTNAAGEGPSLKVTDRPVYGSSRLGSYTRQIELVGEQAITNYPYTQPMQAPLKRYELTDHLGNVATVVTGRLLPLLGPGVQYHAEVVSATGYEAFGFALPNRSFQSSNYGFGFQGKPKDDEIYGSTGTSYDFGSRIYDPRAGRWLSLDPLARQYPNWSPYNFVMNSPIQLIDPNGMSVDNYTIDPAGKVALSEKTDDDFDKLTAIDDFGDEISTPLTINDRTLLPQLAASPRDAKIPGGSEPMNIGFTTDKVAATDLFKFASDNTNVEWGLMGFRTDEIERFAIGTSHAESHVASMDQFFNLYDKTFDIHSHPGPPGEASQDIHFGFGGWGDVPRAQQQAIAFQKKDLPLPALGVYHVPSQGLYSYTHEKRNVFEGYIRTGKDLRDRLP